MNWIERLYDIQKLGRKDLYSQNGEGLYLEYISRSLDLIKEIEIIDIGGGDGFYLSNTRHLASFGPRQVIDKENGMFVALDTIHSFVNTRDMKLLSIDIDGNDYWILKEMLNYYSPSIIIAEFNAAFTDSRTIKYNHDHVWDGTDYYGFSFEAGKKLAEANRYKVIFQNDNLNMYMVREDLIKVSIPEVTFQQTEFFQKSNRTDWEWI